MVQPNRDKHATNYRISMNYKQEVVPPTPELPENGVLSKSAYFREFLLTKSTYAPRPPQCQLETSGTLTVMRS